MGKRVRACGAPPFSADDGLDGKGTGQAIRLDRKKQPAHLMS